MMNDVNCELLDGSGNGGTGVGSTDKIKGGMGMVEYVSILNDDR